MWARCGRGCDAGRDRCFRYADVKGNESYGSRKLSRGNSIQSDEGLRTVAGRTNVWNNLWYYTLLVAAWTRCNQVWVDDWANPFSFSVSVETIQLNIVFWSISEAPGVYRHFRYEYFVLTGLCPVHNQLWVLAFPSTISKKHRNISIYPGEVEPKFLYYLHQSLVRTTGTISCNWMNSWLTIYFLILVLVEIIQVFTVFALSVRAPGVYRHF